MWVGSYGPPLGLAMTWIMICTRVDTPSRYFRYDGDQSRSTVGEVHP